MLVIFIFFNTIYFCKRNYIMRMDNFNYSISLKTRLSQLKIISSELKSMHKSAMNQIKKCSITSWIFLPGNAIYNECKQMYPTTTDLYECTDISYEWYFDMIINSHVSSSAYSNTFSHTPTNIGIINTIWYLRKLLLIWNN